MKHLTITRTVLNRVLIAPQKTALGFVFGVLGASGSSSPAMRWLVAPVVVRLKHRPALLQGPQSRFAGLI